MEQLQRFGIEPILLGNDLFLDGEAVRGPNELFYKLTQDEWQREFAVSGKRLPTVREYVTAIKKLSESKHPALNGILHDLQEDALCTGLKINYENSNLPLGEGKVDELIKDPAWLTALQDEIFNSDVREATEVLQKASRTSLYFLTPDAKGRKSFPERAVWLYISAGGFYLNCYGNPIDLRGRARGVREGSAEGGAKKYNKNG